MRVTLGPEVNLTALCDYVDAEGVLRKGVPIARACDCGETHHPKTAPMAGARYYIRGRWLCGACCYAMLAAEIETARAR